MLKDKKLKMNLQLFAKGDPDPKPDDPKPDDPKPETVTKEDVKNIVVEALKGLKEKTEVDPPIEKDKNKIPPPQPPISNKNLDDKNNPEQTEAKGFWDTFFKTLWR